MYAENDDSRRNWKRDGAKTSENEVLLLQAIKSEKMAVVRLAAHRREEEVTKREAELKQEGTMHR